MDDVRLEWPEDGFADWIGRTSVSRDLVRPALVEQFQATMPAMTASRGDDGSLPLCLHWCLAPVAEPADRLGRDGHPRLGLHLPPIPLPRRMWAGGSIEFCNVLRVGDEVERRSTITSVERKEGRSGPLAFVTIRHEYVTGCGTVVDEIQELVYRMPPRTSSPHPEIDAAAGKSAGTVKVVTEPVMLFRYSALTFNGHRIHYDQRYAMEDEGYPGLVVHGPLIATLLANLAASHKGSIRRFSFRAQSPLICGEPLDLAIRHEGALEARSTGGRLVMSAQAG